MCLVTAFFDPATTHVAPERAAGLDVPRPVVVVERVGVAVHGIRGYPSSPGADRARHGAEPLVARRRPGWCRRVG